MSGLQSICCEIMPSSDEKIYPVLLQLDGSVRARLHQFFYRREFVGMRPSEIIGILLDREEVYGESSQFIAADASPDYVNAVPLIHQQNGTLPSDSIGATSTLVLVSGRSGVPFVQDQRGDQEQTVAVYLDEGGNIVPEDRVDENYGTPAALGGRSNQNVEDRNDDGLNLARQQEEPNVHEFIVAGQQHWTTALRRRWYEAVVRWQQDGLLHCRLCNSSMNVVERGVGLRAGNAFDHVCKHLEKPMFSCRICGYYTVSSMEVRDHVRTAHQADTRIAVDFITLYQMELEQMITECFGPPENNNNTVVPTNVPASSDGHKKRKGKKPRKGRVKISAADSASGSENSTSSARQLCCQMIDAWQRDNALYCKICDQWLRVGAKKNWMRAENAMHHVCGHLGKPLYKCKLCPQSTSTWRQIRQHLQTAHKSRIRLQYVDLTETMQSELKQTVTDCFDWKAGEGGPPANEGGRFMKATLRTGLANNAKRREVLLHCRRLIRMYSRDSRIQCQLCGTAFVAMTANGYALAETVFNHCLKHLEPGPYACRVCFRRTHNTANMRTHIWSKHKDVALTEFTDYTNQLHDEIVVTLDQCFIANRTDVDEAMDHNENVGMDQRGSDFNAPCIATTADVANIVSELPILGTEPVQTDGIGHCVNLDTLSVYV